MWCMTFYLEILEISAMGNTDLSPLNSTLFIEDVG